MRRRFGFLVGYVSDSRMRSLIAAVLCFLGLGAIELFIHQTLRTMHLSPFQDAAVDAGILGLTFGLAVWLLLGGNRERRRRVREELERIAELNHEIRNALEVIAHTHYFDDDEKHRGMVLESVSRIDKVLKRVLRIVDTRNIQPSEQAARMRVRQRPTTSK